MSYFEVDLTNCENELIHIPGQVQSHGFLIVVDDDNIIRFFSANIGIYIHGIMDNLIGQPLQYVEQLLKNTDRPDLIVQLINVGKAGKSFDITNPVEINIAGVLFYLIISTTEKYFLLEFEPVLSDLKVDVQKMIGRSISQILADKKVEYLLNNTVVQIKDIIQYDRVMIYRFADDGHGEIMAEAKNEGLEPWVGLHYPASDIPKQAKELYKLNLTRIIANVHITPSKIITGVVDQQPLDLTYSQLRAVSPMHIQYLKNMGVASSFSISLLHKDKLWGLIACHNYTPRFIDFKARESAKLVGQILSSALEFRQDEDNQQLNDFYKSNLDKLSNQLLKSTNIEDALTKENVNILQVVNGKGAILVYEKMVTKLGITPDDKQITDLVDWIKCNHTEPIFSTIELSATYPAAAAYKDIASGILVIVLSKELEEYIVWFKPEVLQMVTWAGKPEKLIEIKPDGTGQLTPRNSFGAWAQNVSNTSEAWNKEEIKSVTRLREEITYAINLKAGAIRLLNEKLRQAYDELDTFSYTISHDLKNPITAIKSYAQLLTTDKATYELSQKILGRIAERADKMNFMIDSVLDYSRIGKLEIQYQKINIAHLINDVIKDVDLENDTSKLQITLGKMPDLFGDPTMINQVFSNLVSNAFKYAQHQTPALIHIEGTVNENDILYTIKDNGLGIAAQHIPLIFALFSRMDNVKDIEGTGVGLSIVKRIIEKHHGRIWVESELDKGSTFFVSFNKHLPASISLTNHNTIKAY